MIRTLKRLVGIFVGYFVLKAQFIPIGKTSLGRRYNARWHYSPGELKELSELWNQFNQRNARYERILPRHYVHVKRNLLLTPEGSKLDTVEFSPNTKQRPKDYIIYGWGRNNHYELYLHRMAEDAINMNKNIISFNYRGVGSSEGTLTSEHDLVNDYLFQINRLLKQGVPANRIQCYGHSLGGAVATCAVYELYQKGINLKLFNDRSFGNLIDTSVALFFKRPSRRRRIVNVTSIILASMLILPMMIWSSSSFLTLAFSWMIISAATYSDIGHPLFNKTVGWCLENGLDWAMRFGGWHLNVAHKYDALPMDQKSHMIIHSPTKHPKDSIALGKRKIEVPSQDRIIFYEDSLHRHLHGYRHEIKKHKSEVVKGHPDHPKTLKHKEVLLKLSHARVTGGDHSDHPNKLLTWYPGLHRRHHTGQERIYHFFDEKGGHMGPKPKKYKIH